MSEQGVIRITMQLIKEQRYKIIIADEPDVVTRGFAGLYIPISTNSETGANYIRNKDLDDATKYIKQFLERELNDSQNSETESETEDEDYDDDDDWSPPPSPIPVSFEFNDELEEDPIDEEELQELLAVLENIVRTNPNLLDDPRPVIDLDIYKYGSFVTGSDELVWEFEYCIHESPSQTYAAG